MNYITFPVTTFLFTLRTFNLSNFDLIVMARFNSYQEAMNVQCLVLQ